MSSFLKKENPRRGIFIMKSFSGGPGGRFYKKAPLANELPEAPWYGNPIREIEPKSYESNWDGQV